MNWPVEKYEVLLKGPYLLHIHPLSPNTLTHTHTHTLTEAVVLFDYEKQQDDELSLKLGDIITDVKQVREQFVHWMYHNYVERHVSYNV